MFGPRAAQACDEPPASEQCELLDVTIVETTLAADGVLIFEVWPRFSTDEDQLANVLVTVTDPDGAPIAGTLEAVVGFDTPKVLAWRPQAPWVPASGYGVEVTVDFAALLPELAVCTEPMKRAVAEFSVEAATLPPLTMPPFTVQEELFEYDIGPTIDTAVCCDGASPEADTCSGQLTYDTGFCAGTQKGVLLEGNVTFDLATVAPSMLGNVGVRYLDDHGEVQVASPLMLAPEFSAPFIGPARCGRLELVDFARGEIVGTELCIGQDNAAELGIVASDPSEVLADHCSGRPYVCASLDAFSWDDAQCEPWSPDGGENGGENGDDIAGTPGCGCSASSRTRSTWWAGWLLVVGLARRSRPSRRKLW